MKTYNSEEFPWQKKTILYKYLFLYFYIIDLSVNNPASRALYYLIYHYVIFFLCGKSRFRIDEHRRRYCHKKNLRI